MSSLVNIVRVDPFTLLQVRLLRIAVICKALIKVKILCFLLSTKFFLFFVRIGCTCPDSFRPTKPFSTSFKLLSVFCFWSSRLNSVTNKKSPNVYKKWPNNDFTGKMKAYNTFKMALKCGDLGKIIVATGLEKLPKVQLITQSGHTDQESDQFRRN